VPLFRHLEAIKGLLLGSFELGEGLPQAMERLLFRPFEKRSYLGGFTYPTLASLARSPAFAGNKSLIDEVIDELGYDERGAQVYKAALKLRMESFSRGTKKHLFEHETVPFTELLERPVFIDLRDLTDADTRRFFVGALLIRLYGERESAHKGAAGPAKLRHLVVLEEAHHFLREASGGTHAARLAQQSNELLANAFAELRSYGQGILVADQAPAELSAAVLRNTATKIVHTLFHEADCSAIADAIGLEHSHRGELRRLRTGEAIVMGPSTPTPVMCKVDGARRR
jgi:DNA helicase HerA-like ATPase